MTMRPRIKPRPCKQCKQEYVPTRALQSVCSLPCALEQSRSKQAKEQKKKDIQWKRDNKTWSEWDNGAQKACRRYIRARDKGKPCISCGIKEQKRIRASHFDCGHWRSVGSAHHLRMHFLNQAGQCVRCNQTLGGNSVEYRKGLIKRIGRERVEALEVDNGIKKYDIDQLKRMTKLFNKRAKYYEKRRPDPYT